MANKLTAKTALAAKFRSVIMTSNISARSLNVSHQALLPAVGLKNYFKAIK